MDVSVIMVNYNTVNLLCNAIDSVFSMTSSLEYEIIVVDNRSTDDTTGIIKRKYGGKVKVLSLPQNIGFGRANNAAAAVAKGRNILLLNPDTLLLNNAVKILSDYIDNNGTGIAGGNLFDEKRDPAFSYRRFLPSIFWELNDLLFTLPEKLIYGKCSFFNYSSEPLNVAYISGADLMISRHLFEKLGGFDPDYFLYFEETDLACRVKELNYKVVNIPQAKVMHMESASFAARDMAIRYYFSGKLIYYLKHKGKIYIWFLNLIMNTTFHSRIILFTLIGKRAKKQYWRRLWVNYKSAKTEYKEGGSKTSS
jgi:hypothetical protein